MKMKWVFQLAVPNRDARVLHAARPCRCGCPALWEEGLTCHHFCSELPHFGRDGYGKESVIVDR